MSSEKVYFGVQCIVKHRWWFYLFILFQVVNVRIIIAGTTGLPRRPATALRLRIYEGFGTCRVQPMPKTQHALITQAVQRIHEKKVLACAEISARGRTRPLPKPQIWKSRRAPSQIQNSTKRLYAMFSARAEVESSGYLYDITVLNREFVWSSRANRLWSFRFWQIWGVFLF